MATLSLVIINVIIFSSGFILNSQSQIILEYGFIPNQLFKDIDGNKNNLDVTGQGISSSLSSALLINISTRLFSSMFIHASIGHLAFNLLALIYLGGFAEKSIGVIRYLIIYVFAGMAGALLHGIVASNILDNGDIALVGASGAISGVLGIAATIGNTRAYYWLILQVVFAVIGSITAIPIAFSAHIGGFVAGAILTKIVVEIERKKRLKYFNTSEDNYDLWKR